MHRVIAGCNLWAVAFLIGAMALGILRAPYHVALGVFALVFALLSQAGIFALFMGASKLLKEHVERFQLGGAFVDRTNAIMFPLFRWASVGSLTVLLQAILAGLAASEDVPRWIHAVTGIATIAVLVAATRREVPAMARMHDLLVEMEGALPGGDTDAGGEVQPPVAEAPPDRARGLVYIGATVLAMLLGYRFISGIELPISLTLAVGALALLCLLIGLSALRRQRP